MKIYYNGFMRNYNVYSIVLLNRKYSDNNTTYIVIKIQRKKFLEITLYIIT